MRKSTKSVILLSFVTFIILAAGASMTLAFPSSSSECGNSGCHDTSSLTLTSNATGTVNATVGEYSMSVVGPGPRALHLWELAKKRNLKTIAKIQVNNTWELSAIPYLPVMIAETRSTKYHFKDRATND